MFIKFLTLLYEEGLSYSSINTARSAVSSLSWTKEKTLGNHVLITKLMKGIFNLRPSIPKTKVTWDTGMVLQFLKKWHPAKNLSLRQLSIKTTLLCLLVSGQRGQTIWLMDLRNLDIQSDHIKCKFGDLLKTSSVKSHQQELVFQAYPKDKSLCVVHYLKQYILRTKKVRREGENRLFIISRPPHGAVSRDTIARWTKEGLHKSGIDTAIFSAHSTRAASTSKAKETVKLSTILTTAGWRGSSTFARFYDKPIVKTGWSMDKLL